ncbi:N-acetyltransferase family protein [Aestuariivirga sp.]|uniref:GNAT family N-acetyltransferase n=1 Tax=Aestuariivirga sp. TaxID=2650926 RepID=UPI00391D9DA0
MSPFPPRPPGQTRLPDGLTIRDFREGDEDGLLAALRDLQAHEGQFHARIRPAETMGPWYVERLKREVAEGRGRLMVAEAAAGVVGYAALTFSLADDDKAELPYSFAEVGDLAVAADARGHGVGTALLSACEAEARRRGVDVLRVGVLARNASARAFYLRNGLEEVYVTMERPLR